MLLLYKSNLINITNLNNSFENLRYNHHNIIIGCVCVLHIKTKPVTNVF